MTDSREKTANVYVGEQIKRVRGKKLSQRALAARLGLAHRTLGDMELGRSPISIGRLLMIAEELKAPITAFLPATANDTNKSGETSS